MKASGQGGYTAFMAASDPPSGDLPGGPAPPEAPGNTDATTAAARPSHAAAGAPAPSQAAPGSISPRRPPSGVWNREQLTEALLNHSVLESVTEGVLVVDRDGNVRYGNQLLMTLFGVGPAQIKVGRPAHQLINDIREILVDPEQIVAPMSGMMSGEIDSWEGELEMHDGRVLEGLARNLYEESVRLGRIWLFRDITAPRRAAEALRESEAQQREVIAEQRRLIETIREMGTPVLPIYDRVLVLPLVGHIDSERSSHIMDALLDAIQRFEAKVVILDITGVTMVDTAVANSLIQATRAAALLGAQCVLVGISAQVSRTIVQLGVDLSSVVTRRDLQAGIAYALRQVGCSIVVDHAEPDWLALDAAGELTGSR